MQPQAIAGAAERFRDRYQRDRVVKQFALGSPLASVARREKIARRLVEQVLRDRLAEQEFGEAA